MTLIPTKNPYTIHAHNVIIILCAENRSGQAAPPYCENSPTAANPPALTTIEPRTLDKNIPVGAILGSITGIGCTVCVAAALAFLIAAAALYKHHKKKQHSHNRLFNNNHTTESKLVLFSLSLGLLVEAQLSTVHDCIIIGAKGNSEFYEPSRDSELTTASLPYVFDPTEPHDYEKIPETKLQSLRTEQVVKLTELDSNCHPKAPQPCMDVEDHAYVIPAIVSLPFQADGSN